MPEAILGGCGGDTHWAASHLALEYPTSDLGCAHPDVEQRFTGKAAARAGRRDDGVRLAGVDKEGVD